MSERPTPETDAFIERNIAHNPTGWEWRVHSRRLERERDEALAYLDAAHYATCNKELRQQRDEAREKLAHVTSAAQAVVDRWDLPAWKDAEPTAAVIYRLRDSLQEARP